MEKVFQTMCLTLSSFDERIPPGEGVTSPPKFEYLHFNTGSGIAVLKPVDMAGWNIRKFEKRDQKTALLLRTILLPLDLNVFLYDGTPGCGPEIRLAREIRLGIVNCPKRIELTSNSLCCVSVFENTGLFAKPRYDNFDIARHALFNVIKKFTMNTRGYTKVVSSNDSTSWTIDNPYFGCKSDEEALLRSEML